MKAAIIDLGNIDFVESREICINQIAEILINCDYNVTIFKDRKIKENDRNDNLNIKYMNNVSIHRVFNNKFELGRINTLLANLIYLFSFKKICNQINDYDLYYFVKPNLLFSKSIKYFLKQKKNPEIILGNLGTYFEFLNNKFLSKLLIPIFNNMFLSRIKRFKIKIHAQNDFQKNFYLNFGSPENSIAIIPQYGIDFKEYVVGNNNNFNVIFLNKLTRNNGINLLKKLIKYSNFSIIIVNNNKELKNKYKKFSNVKFYNYISEVEKHKIIENSDVVINLSKYEYLGSTSMEGLASGLYLVGKNNTALNFIKSKINKNITLINGNQISNYINVLYTIKNFKEIDIQKYYESKLKLKENAEIIFDKNVIEYNLKNFILDNPQNSNKISIVTASLNEKENISQWLDNIINLIKEKSLNMIDEVVIVDDGSKDGTVEIIENYSKKILPFKINLIKRNKKMGTVNAQITAAKYAKNPYIIVLDCDLQHPVRYIYDFVLAYKYGYDIIIGSRYMESGKNNWTPERGLISRTATFISKIMFFPFLNNIKDPLSGYFFVKKDLMANLYPYKFMYKPLLYTLIFNLKDRNYLEIPISMQNRVNGSSKIVTSYSCTVFLYYKELFTYFIAAHKKNILPKIFHNYNNKFK